MSYLREWTVTLDFDQSEIVFAKEPTEAERGYAKIPISIRGGCPYVKMAIDGAEMEALIDTGFIGTLLVETATFDKIAPPRGPKRLPYYCKRLSVGELSHESYFVGFHDTNILGLYFWNKYRTTFDFKNECIYLLPREGASMVDHDAYDGACCSEEPLRGKRTIGLCVIKNSPAYKQGLRWGDILLELNDRSVDKLDKLQIDRLWCQRGKKPLKVRVLRNGIDVDESNDTIVTATFPAEDN